MDRDCMYDMIIIGAGIAGCATAVAFANQGRKKILLLERSLKEPDRIVGELLQPGGVEALCELGLASSTSTSTASTGDSDSNSPSDDGPSSDSSRFNCLEGIDATPIEGYHLYWKDQETSFWFGEKDRKKLQGWSFHHGRFVTKLREAAAARYPNVTLLERTVVEILWNDADRVIGVLCSGVDGKLEQFFAPLTILADGSTSNFRTRFSPHQPKSQSRFWALEMASAKLPIPRYAHAVLGHGPPILMYPISSHETRILIDIPNHLYTRLGGPRGVRIYLAECVLPILPRDIQPQLRSAIKEGRLRSMPNTWIPSAKQTTPGLIMIGDALNMRHPLTGAGMTIALRDAILLAKLLDPIDIPNLRDNPQILKKMQTFHWRRKAHSAPLNILAQALYFLFVSVSEKNKNLALQIIQRGFIGYVQKGERYFREPAWILGGVVLDRDRWASSSFCRLFYHFFAVVVYSLWLHLQEQQQQFFMLVRAVGQAVLVLVAVVRIIWEPLVDELK